MPRKTTKGDEPELEPLAPSTAAKVVGFVGAGALAFGIVAWLSSPTQPKPVQRQEPEPEPEPEPRFPARRLPVLNVQPRTNAQPRTNVPGTPAVPPPTANTQRVNVRLRNANVPVVTPPINATPSAVNAGGLHGLVLAQQAWSEQATQRGTGWLADPVAETSTATFLTPAFAHALFVPVRTAVIKSAGDPTAIEAEATPLLALIQDLGRRVAGLAYDLQERGEYPRATCYETENGPIALALLATDQWLIAGGGPCPRNP